MGSPIVLLVDDDPATLRVMMRVLTSDQYVLITALSGTEALDLVKSLLGRSVKLMILDLSLTDMSGLALAEKAKALVPDLKVLYVSGYTGSEDHANDWFTKPIDVDALRARILSELNLP